LTEPKQRNVKFVHPIEEAFVKILNFYGIAWEYEPKTFALSRDENGVITEAFTPDFFLPEQNMFIELTTLRPQLIRHKNRKLRRIKELYPEVNIKLLKRSDLRDLMIKYEMYDLAEPITGTAAQAASAQQSQQVASADAALEEPDVPEQKDEQ